MTDTFLVLAAIFFLGVAFGREQDSFRSEGSEKESVSEIVSADMVTFVNADNLIRGCLADVHRSSASVADLIANLKRSFGMDKASVLDRFIQIAASPQEPKETKTAALFAFCAGAGEPGLGRLRVFFADENDEIRQTSLSATMGTLSTVSSQLNFLKERLDAWSDNERFQNDALVLVGRFHQILQYKSGSEEDLQNVLSFFRARAKNPSFASCAFGCESILVRFDPDWPTSPDRRELLRRWKDDSSLSEYVRTKMNEAWTSCPPDSVFSTDAVPESETVRSNPEPSAAGFGDGGSDSLGDSPQSADSGGNAASPAIWILGAAALALAAALACLAIRRNRGR